MSSQKIGLVHIVWQAVLFGIPLMLLLLMSFRTYEYGLPTGKLTFENYQKLFGDQLLYTAMLNTVIVGVIVSVISTLLALLAIICAWNLRSSFIRNALLYACAIVFFIGLIPRSFVFQYLLSEQGPFSAAGRAIGLTSLPFQLYSFSGVIMGYMPVFIPLSVMVLFIARKEVRREYAQVARELGARNFNIQTGVIIPQIRTSIFISLILTFLLCIADVIIIDLIGGSRIYSVSSLIMDFIKIDDWGMAAGVSFIFLVLILALLYFISKVFLKPVAA